MKRLLTVLIVFLSILASVSATIRQPIQNFYKMDYKLGAQNWGVSQQRNGLMYFANMNGLLSYDGIRWTSSQFPGSGNNVRSLKITPAGDIYVGAYNEFGVFKAQRNGLSEYESLSALLPEKDLTFGEIWHISILNNSIIFQGTNQIFFYENGQITKLDTPAKIKFSAVFNNALYLTSDTDGVFVLIGTSFISLPNCEELQNKSVCAILPMEDNAIAFITESHGIYDYQNGEMKKSTLPINDILIKYQAFCAEINGQTLAVGTVQNGVVVLNLKTKEYTIINMDSGLQNNTVLSLDFDMEGNLWLGLDKGIDYVKINSPFRSLFAQNNPYGSGYCSLIVGSDLYLGTNQGLFVTKYANSEIGAIETIDGTQGQVYAIKQIDNHIYCCHHKGLFEINDKYSRKIANIEGVWTIQKLRSNPNYLIAGHYNGFFLMKKQDGFWVFSHNIEGFNESSRLFEQDEAGDIWMSHGLKGVYRIHLSKDLKKAESVKFYGTEKGFPTNEHISVFSVNGDLIFAAEDGLHRYNSATDFMDVNTQLTNSLLGGGQYYSLKEYQDDRLWFVKFDQIGLAIKQKDDVYTCNPNKCFSIPEELLYEYFDLNALDSENILVSNEEGFTLVNLEMLDKTNLFDVFIRQIYSTKSEKNITSQYLKTTEEFAPIKIPYSDNSLRFTFGTVSFSSNKNNQTLYSTRLLNYEDNWSKPNLSSSREYTNLHEGTYTFQVKTFNRNSESSFTEYTFTISPPWYRSFWAYAIYFLLLIGLLLLLRKYIQYKESLLENENKKQMEAQKKLHEEESAEKEKEIIALKNEQLSSELVYKSNELASSTMNLIRKNEVLIDIKDEISKIAGGLSNSEEGKSISKKLTRLVHSINSNIEHDDDWMKFEQNFDNIHQDFMKRLSEQYKGLTVSDKKLCAYLKMNLVSKDIAPLLNISVRGVEIGRYRLRKKLNLDRDTNLTEFLQNF